MLMEGAGSATETTLSIMDGLVRQFANVESGGVLMYAVLMLVAGYICLEGYGIYKMALAAVGFAVGYSRSHEIIALISSRLDMELTQGLSDEQMLMVQAGVGLVCGILAYFVVRAGIFIAAYHFAQANLAAIGAQLLLDKVNVPELLIPLATRLLGLLIAALVAWLAVKSERMVVVVVTAVVGGFAAVNFFLKLLPLFPVDLSYLLRLPEVVWVAAKLFLSGAGVGVQGVKKRGK